MSVILLFGSVKSMKLGPAGKEGVTAFLYTSWRCDCFMHSGGLSGGVYWCGVMVCCDGVL